MKVQTDRHPSLVRGRPMPLTLTPESRYIANLLREMLQASEHGMVGVAEDLTRIARAHRLKPVSRAHLIAVREERSNAGAKLEPVIAAKFHGGSIDAMKRSAREWVASHGAEPASVLGAADPIDRYPSRVMAARWAREAGIPEDAIRIALGVVLEGPDPGARFWLDFMDSQARAGNAPIGEELPRPPRKKR